MMPPAQQIPAKHTVIPYYLIAVIAFLIVIGLCIPAAEVLTGHHFHPKILAITHLAVLGWATMLIFGASNQLAPVLSEHALYSEHIPCAVLVLLTAGTSLLVINFWRFSFGAAIFTGGSLVLLAFGLQAWNQFHTFRAGKESIATRFILTAQLWLLLTAALGLLLLINLRYSFLPASHLEYLKVHAAVGMAGWFLQLVTGVSSKLIPMFLLSQTTPNKLLSYTYYFFNGGLALFLITGIVAGPAVIAPIALLLILAGVIFYSRYVYICRRSAMRKRLDHGMRQTFLAISLLILPLVLLGISVLAGRRLPDGWGTAFGYSFMAGFISIIIMGQTFKTLPFIIWMHINSPDEPPELMPANLYREGLVRLQMWLYAPGYLLLITGILLGQVRLLYAGIGLMMLAAAVYAGHVLYIISKLKCKWKLTSAIPHL
ncbi:hypothetical protein [Chitinophaga flava]|uniref:Cytochrome C oxidase subunit I n=1 Tax=Chitinophaga flava TaxID=2259036 RepID=A0A365Y198_9BACT|nr:hypothetical protein [Chitinophaga flava]RBL91694.1 hypothetical protein DF182_03540 [Chitinophaga flava]